MEGISIREARMEDIPTLLQFEQGVISAERPFDATIKPDPVHYYDLTEMLRATHIALLVATDGERLVGSGYARIEPARHFQQHSQQAYLGFMYTLEDYRGRGVNQAIIEALTQWAVTRNVYELRLDVYADNLPAIRAYEKAGFVPDLIQMKMQLPMNGGE